MPGCELGMHILFYNNGDSLNFMHAIVKRKSSKGAHEPMKLMHYE